MNYLKGSNGDVDIANRFVDIEGEGEGGMNWESSFETYTLPYVKLIASGNLLYDVGSSKLVLWDRVEVGREFQEGEDVCILMADSCWCMAETNTLRQLSSN